MNAFHLQDPAPKKAADPSGQSIFPLPEENTDFTEEGSEFLDDAIRTVEQPFLYTEESIAAGSPDHLL